MSTWKAKTNAGAGRTGTEYWGLTSRLRRDMMSFPQLIKVAHHEPKATRVCQETSHLKFLVAPITDGILQGGAEMKKGTPSPGGSPLRWMVGGFRKNATVGGRQGFGQKSVITLSGTLGYPH